MINATDVLRKNIASSIQAKQELLLETGTLTQINSAIEMIIERYRGGGRLYIAGNGGSAADAQHLAAELVSKLAHDRAPLPAEALTVDTSILTAIGNDYGFDELFSRQVAGKMTDKDIFLGITTSGCSLNICKALEVCRKKNIPTVVFTGHDGGTVKALADYCIIVPGKTTATIQEVHIVLAHTLCECIENAIFKF